MDCGTLRIKIPRFVGTMMVIELVVQMIGKVQQENIFMWALI